MEAEAVRAGHRFTCALIVVLVACDKGSSSPPEPAPVPPPPAPPTTPAVTVDAGDACEAQMAEVAQASVAVQKALADQKLVPIARGFLKTPFGTSHGGRAPAPAEETAKQRGRKAFANKHTGDHVEWNDGHRTWAGMVVEPKPGWTLAQRDNKVFYVGVKSMRTITCVDPATPSGTCDQDAPSPWLIAPPDGTTFGGTITLDVEQLRLERTGGPPMPCPPPPHNVP